MKSPRIRTIAARRLHLGTIHVVGTESAQHTSVADELMSLGYSLRCPSALRALTPANPNERAVAVLVDDGQLPAQSVGGFRTWRSTDAATFAILALPKSSRLLNQLAAFARAGLDSVCVVDDADALGRLRDRVATHLTNALPSGVVRAAIPAIQNDATSVLAMCVRQGDHPHTADHFARWLRWDRKTLYRKLRQAGLRPIHQLIQLGRLLHAAEILDQCSATVEAVSTRLHFGSSSTLRRLAKRETGYTPTQLRNSGAVVTTLAAFEPKDRRH